MWLLYGIKSFKKYLLSSACVCPSVAYNNSGTPEHISMKFHISDFIEIRRYIQVLVKIGQNNGHITWRLVRIFGRYNCVRFPVWGILRNRAKIWEGFPLWRHNPAIHSAHRNLIYFKQLTERRGRVMKTPASYSGGPGFKSRLRRPDRFFVVSLSPSRRISRQYFKIMPDRFLRDPFQFITILLSSYHRRYIV
jgi:hypothetical protein